MVAAVITDNHDQVLLSLRPPHVPQGNLWEFPGGKVEAGEEVLAALARELDEELGIRLISARCLLKVRHDYPDRAVFLEFWRVTRYQGCPRGREGQTIRWLPRRLLPRKAFPAANLPLIRALQLPAVYLISPEMARPDDYLSAFRRIIQAGIPLVQLRAKHLDAESFVLLARQLIALCRGTDTRLLLNCEPEAAAQLGADGVHLSSHRLRALSRRPCWGAGKLVGASCHNHKEVAHACQLGLDFIAISPVLATRSHPGSDSLGWRRFRALAEAATVPVYALGGMSLRDLEQAQICGAWGIAAISAFCEPGALEACMRMPFQL